MQKQSNRKKMNISVGVIRNNEGEIFITQRGEGSHLAGYWEFPGGKIKQGETPEQALFRELEEEVDILTDKASLLTTLEYSYSDRDVVLHFFVVERWDGEPFAKEGQNSRWVPQHELNSDDFPEANMPVIEMLLV